MIALTSTQMRTRAATIREKHTEAQRSVTLAKSNLAEFCDASKTAKELASIVSEAAQAAQLRFASVVAGIVTESLNSVYPDNPYEFKMEFRECAGKTVVDTLLYRDGDPLDPMSSTGGGVWDVLAFALRVSLLLLTADDNTRKLLVLDEPFKFLHGAEKIRRAYETMETVGRQFGLTILCVRQL